MSRVQYALLVGVITMIVQLVLMNVEPFKFTSYETLLNALTTGGAVLLVSLLVYDKVEDKK